MSALAERLMQRFWPGALTIVLPKKPSYRTLAAAGSETIGVRQPADVVLCEIALQLAIEQAEIAAREAVERLKIAEAGK
ncbi:MAG: Sua5/YciO/YrdC/YwlC family protein, partial [Alicyclobacillus sp.]|nr:Sua5/YciO/YrdC/YwlC family protein [Alicyclobacillus sp.]